MQKRLTAFFSGTVQGVGFRFTVERLTRQFHLTGYVKNLKDGRVELVAEGEEQELTGLLRAIRESSLERYSQDVETSWGNAQGNYRIFEIAH